MCNQNQVIASIVMPLRNEEKYIKQCIESLLEQNYSKKNMEFIFVDGQSTDHTKDIIQSYIEKYPEMIKLLDNPNKTVPYAMNIGIRMAQGKYIIRLDAHSEYAVDYISQCVYHLDHTDADNVGGPMVAKAITPLQEVIAASYSSRFALGGGRFHDEQYEGYADTVYLGSFRKEALFDVGLYDEQFTRNQDDELNFRFIESGKKIFITPKIKSIYYPRESYKRLFNQYYQYGWWKVAVLKKHGKPARITHLIPGLFVGFCVIGAMASFCNALLAAIYLFVISLYLILVLCTVGRNKSINGFKNRLRLSWVIFILHMSYGTGFIAGLLKVCKQ